jgi:dihydrodipicolinate reductase
MKQSTSIVWLFVFAAIGVAHAQAPSSDPKPDQSAIVEAVGCLSQTGADWILANATDAVVARTPFTTPEAVKAATEKALGTQRYRLLGTTPFSPDRHKGHKMVVRGLLIKSGSDTRINVTSFQMLAETCAK